MEKTFRIEKKISINLFKILLKLKELKDLSETFKKNGEWKKNIFVKKLIFFSFQRKEKKYIYFYEIKNKFQLLTFKMFLKFLL